MIKAGYCGFGPRPTRTSEKIGLPGWGALLNLGLPWAALACMVVLCPLMARKAPQDQKIRAG